VSEELCFRNFAILVCCIPRINIKSAANSDLLNYPNQATLIGMGLFDATTFGTTILTTGLFDAEPSRNRPDSTPNRFLMRISKF